MKIKGVNAKKKSETKSRHLAWRSLINLSSLRGNKAQVLSKLKQTRATSLPTLAATKPANELLLVRIKTIAALNLSLPLTSKSIPSLVTFAHRLSPIYLLKVSSTRRGKAEAEIGRVHDQMPRRLSISADKISIQSLARKRWECVPSHLA